MTNGIQKVKLRHCKLMKNHICGRRDLSAETGELNTVLCDLCVFTSVPSAVKKD